LVGSGKRYADQLSLATYPLAIALAQFPDVTLEKVGLRRFAFVGKLAYHRAGFDGQRRIVTRASLTGFCQKVATAAADAFVQAKLHTAGSSATST
jgi:hypothetical protein